MEEKVEFGFRNKDTRAALAGYIQEVVDDFVKLFLYAKSKWHKVSLT